MPMMWSWLVAFMAINMLHFTGACTQWWMGTWLCIQRWLNRNLPVPMLAASDAVLRDANFCKVGMIGYIFMDTANGLNQGRINMEFWTQLFSEWACIPNAISLVSLGAVVALSAEEKYAWTEVAPPIMLILAFITQLIGGTFGARAMVGSINTTAYWTAREKWNIVHYFQALGYEPTQEGWKVDVYNMTKTTVKGEKCLFERVESAHKTYLMDTEKSTAQEQTYEIAATYGKTLVKIREDHYAKVYMNLEGKADKDLLIYEPPTPPTINFFKIKERQEGQWLYFHMFLVVLATALFWSNYMFFTVDLKQAVGPEGGTKMLREKEMYKWVCFAACGTLIFIYYGKEMVSNCSGLCGALAFMFCGCKTPQGLETRLETYDWKESSAEPLLAEEKAKLKVAHQEDHDALTTESIVPEMDSSADIDTDNPPIKR